MIYKLAALAALLLVAIQFVPYGRDRANPNVQGEPAWDSPRTHALFRRACGDCHSHETRWPWYSGFAPVSWLVYRDVTEGREHFNVSRWGVQKKNEGNEAYEKLREGEMPPWFYLPAHPEAWLSDQEEQALLAGLAETFGRKDHDD